jgi:hypothetical protein
VGDQEEMVALVEPRTTTPVPVPKELPWMKTCVRVESASARVMTG